MSNQLLRVAVSLLLVSSFLSGCASTSSNGSASLSQGNWPICSLIGGLVGGGLGAIESSAWAAGGAAAGAVAGGLICYAQDGDADGDGVFDRRDTCPDTPPNTPVNVNGCPVRSYAPAPASEAPTQDEVIVLSDMGKVLFAFGSAELTPAAREQLADIAKRLGGASLVGVKVVGHTDSIGSESYNQGLSERRARSVADYLVSQGVSADKLTTEGMGESRPIADNDTEEGRAKNRRVEIHVDR